jgi:phage virion morphogenesis protein
MTGIRIEIQGADEALATLQRAIDRTENPRGLFDNIGKSLVERTLQRFIEERGVDGNPWPPSIRALAEGGQTLSKSGDLRGKFTHNATDTGVEIGTNVLYAAIHQFGGTITAKTPKGLRFKVGGQWVTKSQVTIPARPFLGIDDDDEREIERISGDWLADALGGLSDGQG